MPMLDELLRSQSMGAGDEVNPELEQMLSRVQQFQGPMGQQGGPTPAGMTPQMPGPRGVPTQQGTPAAPTQAGMAQPMAPEQANMTYQMLVKAGVPPEIAKQAIAEPKFLQEILRELQSQRQLGAPPQSRPQAGQGTPMQGAPARPMP